MEKKSPPEAKISRSKSSPALLNISAGKKKMIMKSEPAVAVGLPALVYKQKVVPKVKPVTLDDYEKELVGCKLQIGFSIVKLKFLEKELRKTIKFNSKMVQKPSSATVPRKYYHLRSGGDSKEVSSAAAVASYEIVFGSFESKTAAAASTEKERYAKQISECKEYIDKKCKEFLRLRRIWRELKAKKKGVTSEPKPEPDEN